MSVGRAGVPLGCGGIVIVVVLSLLMGANPLEVLMMLQGGGGAPTTTTQTGATSASPEEQQAAEFVSVVLADTEDTWRQIFAQGGQQYADPALVLFTGSVQSACGYNSAAVGPFYCPGDQKVYLDLSFFAELERRFGAPGDFARAYVVAHEVGHHVQTLMGVSQWAGQQRARMSQRDANALSVRQELQADCLAGVWAHHAQDMLEAGDVEEGLRAAAAIGDDTLQKRAQGYVVPESFTHGSAEERVRWLRIGMESGDPDRCDTFAVASR